MLMSRRLLTGSFAVAGCLLATCAAAAIKAIDLPANDMVYDPHAGLLYVSVSSGAEELGNTVTSINPVRGTIVSSVFVGKDPGPLALSQDGRYLYVGLDGAGVRRIDLPAFKANLQFSLGNDPDQPDAPLHAAEIEVQPGHPEVIAVSLVNNHVGTTHRGVAIFENGRRRPKTVPGYVGLRIEFSSDPGVLYGTGYRFYTMKVDAEGVSTSFEEPKTDPFVTGGPLDVTYASGRLFFTSGLVVDTATRLPLGTFDCLHGRSVLAEPDKDRVLISNGSEIKTFRLSTFTPVGSYPLGGIGISSDLVRWGTEGLALRGSKQIFILPPGTLTSPPENPPRTTPLPGFATAAARAVKIIRLPTNDLIQDPRTGLLYASVPSRAGALGNTVTSIDPKRGIIVASVFAGSEPGPLALSEDGKYLYVGLSGAAAVRRIDLPAFEATLQFPVGNDPALGSLLARDIEVQPGHPDVVAIALSRSDDQSGNVAVFERGVRRPKLTSYPNRCNRIEFAASPDLLYCFENKSSGFALMTMKVDSEGVIFLDQAKELISGFGVDIELVSGSIFATSGQVVDPAARSLLGTFPVRSAVSVLPEPRKDQVSFLTKEAILIYRLSTFTLAESLRLPPEALGKPGDLVRWGSDGWAFRTSGDQVVLLPDDTAGTMITTAP